MDRRCSLLHQQHRVRLKKFSFLDHTIGQARRKSFKSIPTDQSWKWKSLASGLMTAAMARSMGASVYIAVLHYENKGHNKTENPVDPVRAGEITELRMPVASHAELRLNLRILL
jgi:hypothetical protein